MSVKSSTNREAKVQAVVWDMIRSKRITVQEAKAIVRKNGCNYLKEVPLEDLGGVILEIIEACHLHPHEIHSEMECEGGDTYQIMGGVGT